MAPDTTGDATASPPHAPQNAGAEIVLFSPEHFYVFNTLAVPQLTGYLRERGYPVVPRVLDNELYTHLAGTGTLERAVDGLAARQGELSPAHVTYLAEAVTLARLPEELGFRAGEPARTLAGLLRRRDALVRLLHRSEVLLRERFLELSKNRFLLALARLQVAVDLDFAPFWPSKFGVLGGLEMDGVLGRSQAILSAAGEAALNPFLAYYRSRVVPSIPAGAALAGISITHEAQMVPAFTLAAVIREQRPDLHITLGGATVSTLRQTLAGESAVSALYDSVVFGPGEEAVAGLHDALTRASHAAGTAAGDGAAAGPAGLGEVPNLVWRAPDGALRTNARREFPLARAATPVFTDPRPRPILTLATSSGCDWARCRFCGFPRILSEEGGYDVRPVEAVLRDVETLTERHHPSYFHVCDTNVSVGRLEQLTDAFMQADGGSRFYAFVRAEKAFTSPDFCRRVRAGGFFALHFGLESGSQEVLDRAHKGIDLDDVVTIIDNLDAAGVMVNVFLMAGIPWESEADIDKTVAFTAANLAKIRGEIALCRYFLDPNSHVLQHPEAYGIEVQADPEEDLATSVRFHNPNGYEEDEMEPLVDEVYARIGLPRSYGERFFERMLDDFCPDDLRQRVSLYAPFVWGGVRRGAGRLTGAG